MSEEELVDRVTYWQERLEQLGLRHWDIGVEIVDHPDGNEDSIACMHSSRHYDSADMEFARKHLDDELDDIDKVLIHELLHAATRNVATAFYAAVKKMSWDQRDTFEDSFESALENMIERLARTIHDGYGTL